MKYSIASSSGVLFSFPIIGNVPCCHGNHYGSDVVSYVTWHVLFPHLSSFSSSDVEVYCDGTYNRIVAREQTSMVTTVVATDHGPSCIDFLPHEPHSSQTMATLGAPALFNSASTVMASCAVPFSSRTHVTGQMCS